MPSSSVRIDVAERLTRPPRRSPSMVAIGDSRRGMSSLERLAWLRRKRSIQATSGLSRITWRKI
jgi:hypothetical protein